MGVAAVLFGAPACAAQPPEPVSTPQPDQPCSQSLAGAMAPRRGR